MHALGLGLLLALALAWILGAIGLMIAAHAEGDARWYDHCLCIFWPPLLIWFLGADALVWAVSWARRRWGRA